MVLRKIFSARTGGTRKAKQLKMHAIMQDVPEADSQFKLKMAAYGDTLAVTGGTRAIRLCKPGHAIGMLTEFKGLAMGTQPHSRTHSTNNRYGLQARKTCPVGCSTVVAADSAALSSCLSSYL